MIRPGQEWGQATDAGPDLVVRGDDHDLAEAVGRAPGDALIRFLPHDSELARAIGLANSATRDAPAPEPHGIALPIDLIRAGDDLVVNAAVLGVAPPHLRAHHRRREVQVLVDGREFFRGAATTVVIANGQFITGADLVPRGHPGDGWCEVQVYALTPGERRAMRRRLPGGVHVPHPRILSGRARTVEVTVTGGGWPLTVDGRPHGTHTALRTSLIPGAFRLLV
ncbi:MAG: hypothetical protein JJE46_06480 [Acidimicrobiia bacterium]|nr:hypothetical protein [Acidimicrobiia bacterium]